MDPRRSFRGQATIMRDWVKLGREPAFRETAMSSEIQSAIDFYERHPISSDIILAKLKANRGHLEGLTPD